jgi:hypothetical protein
MLRVLIAAVSGAFRVSATAATGVTKDTSIEASVPVGELSRVAWTGRCPKVTSAAKKQSNRFQFPIGCTNEMISVRVFLSAIYSRSCCKTCYILRNDTVARVVHGTVSIAKIMQIQCIAILLITWPVHRRRLFVRYSQHAQDIKAVLLLPIGAAVNGVKRPGRLELLVLYVRGC